MASAAHLPGHRPPPGAAPAAGGGPGCARCDSRRASGRPASPQELEEGHGDTPLHPFTDDGKRFDAASMRRQLDFVLESEVSAVVACGKAGEFERLGRLLASRLRLRRRRRRRRQRRSHARPRGEAAPDGEGRRLGRRPPPVLRAHAAHGRLLHPGPVRLLGLQAPPPLEGDLRLAPGAAPPTSTRRSGCSGSCASWRGSSACSTGVTPSLADPETPSGLIECRRVPSFTHAP